MIKEKMLLIAFFFLQAFAGLLMAQKSIQKIHVKIRIIEGNTHQTTPAMVCITGIKDGKVRVPPLAIIPDSPSEIKAFYTGIDFKKDKNWIGPVRMTNGIGNNQNRSDIYELLPFELKRWINLPHYGWYSGDVHVHHPTTKPQFKEFLFEYAKSEDIHFVNVLEMGHHLGTDFKQEGFGQKFRCVKRTFVSSLVRRILVTGLAILLV